MHPSNAVTRFGVASAALFILTSSAPAQVQQKRSAMRGHIDRRGGADTEFQRSWNSAHMSRACSQEDLIATGGNGLFYCFAVQ